MKIPFRYLVSFLLLALSCAGASLSEGLAGFWRFDAEAGATAADASPLGNTLRLERPEFAREAGGARSLVCDGFATAAQVEEKTPLPIGRGLTLAVWVRPERTSSLEPIVGRPNAEISWSTPTTGITLVDGRPLFGIFTRGGKVALDGPELPLRAWSLLVATADGKDATLWVDGRKVAEGRQRQPIPMNTGLPFYVGRTQTQFFRGRIGEVRVWSRALAADEIDALYDSTRARYPASAEKLPAVAWRDRTVPVESPGNSLKGGTWRARPTRMLEGLDGYASPPPPPTDRWGGRLDRPAVKATGYFRVEQSGGRWWLVTPEGHLFWNIGVNTFRAPGGTSADAAVQRAFAQRAVSELRGYGFNGISNQYNPAREIASPIPWCARVNFAGSFAKEHGRTYPTSGHVGFAEQCVPVFHPDFPAWCRRVAEQLRPTADDPLVIGIFTDNELQCPIDMLDRHLRLDPQDAYLRHGREAALAWLTARGLQPDPKAFTLRDRYEFIAHLFGTYVQIAHDAVRAVDRNHLILGPRFNVRRGQFDNPWFWRAVGPWIDIAAANYYMQWGPQREEIAMWVAEGKKPVIFSEWYAKAEDAPGLANTNGAGWLVHTQRDRALYYQHFAMNAMEIPGVVGFHYFKYHDDPTESKALDSAGGANKGLYTARGEPWTVLLERAQAVNRAVYPLIDFFDARRATAEKDKRGQQ